MILDITDPNGDALSVTGLTASDGADVVDNLDGTFTIAPALNDNGPVTLSYSVTDDTPSTAATRAVTFDAANSGSDGVRDVTFLINMGVRIPLFSRQVQKPMVVPVSAAAIAPS